MHDRYSGHATTFEAAVHGFGSVQELRKIRKEVKAKSHLRRLGEHTSAFLSVIFFARWTCGFHFYCTMELEHLDDVAKQHLGVDHIQGWRNKRNVVLEKGSSAGLISCELLFP